MCVCVRSCAPLCPSVCLKHHKLAVEEGEARSPAQTERRNERGSDGTQGKVVSYSQGRTRQEKIISSAVENYSLDFMCETKGRKVFT